MPGDKVAVLGLINTKTSKLERRDELLDRLRAATRFLPRERLGISPQCGFSTSIVGNQISPQAQEDKLRCLVETARAFWG